MAVVANFSTSGTAPGVVQFTNTTTGGATDYHWDFGDGETSDSVSPLHTYTGGPFIATLKAWISTGTSIVGATDSSREIRIGTSFVSRDIAYTNWVGSSWSAGTFGGSLLWLYTFQTGSGEHSFLGERAIFTLDLSSESGAIAILEFESEGSTVAESGPITQEFSVSVFPPASPGRSSAFIDVTARLGTVITTLIEDTSFSQLVNAGNAVGWNGATHVVTIHQATDIDTVTGIIGTTSIDFSGTPTSGPSPLSVAFTNLSVVPAGSTYSYKKRLAGTSDAFTEVSTDENPNLIFDKLNP